MVTYNNRRSLGISIFLLVVVGAFLLMGVGPTHAKDRFILGIPGAPYTFHPWDMAQNNSPNHPQFYNRLIILDKQLKPHAEIATEWNYSPDGKIFTMKLRQDVKFHTGKQLTSEDVKRSWLQITKGKFVGSHANLKPLAKLIAEIRTPDPYTAELIYENPNPAVFDFLDLFYIVDMDQWDLHMKQPIGTGPYLMKEYIPGDRTVLVANTEYWGKIPKIKELVYRVIPDPQALVLNLESGTVDGIIFFPSREANRLEKKGLKVYVANPDGVVFDLLYNVTYGPLKDKRVRQAINMMINRNRFHRVIMGGMGDVRCLPWPNQSLAYDADMDDLCKFDPEKAKQLITEAGYPDGFEVELQTCTQMAVEQVKMAEMLQADLKRIGVRVKVLDKERAGYQATYRAKKYQLSTHNFGRGNKDPASLYGTATVWKSKGNTQNYWNPEYDGLIKKASSTLDVDKRKEIYGQLNKMLLDEMFISAVHTKPRYFAHKKEFKNIGSSVDGFMYFFNMEYQP